MELRLFLSEIEKKLSKKRADELAEILVVRHFSIPSLIDLTFHAKDQVAFRAAWILETLSLRHPDRFVPSLEYFLKHFHKQTNRSAQRHFSMILLTLTDKKSAYRQHILGENTEQLVETVFNWLLDKQSPVAVKAHCLDILANFSSVHEWVKDELLKTIDFMVDKESVAFYARAKRVRLKLKG